jgi:hypothetical protein
MKTLFWVLVVCAVGWAFFMAANAPRLTDGPDVTESAGPDSDGGTSKPARPGLDTSFVGSTNIFEEAGKRFTELSTNTVERLKSLDVTQLVEEDRLDQAGLALQSFAYRMTGLWSRLSRDGWIVSSIRARVVSRHGPGLYKIRIESDEGKVVLSGPVASESIRNDILEMARSTQWVEEVDDRMTMASVQ